MHVRRGRLAVSIGLAGLLTAGAVGLRLDAQQGRAPTSAVGSGATSASHVALVDEYCISCHDESEKKADLALDTISFDAVDKHPDVWEKVVRKLRARQMPPIGKPRPDSATYDAVVA